MKVYNVENKPVSREWLQNELDISNVDQVVLEVRTTSRFNSSSIDKLLTLRNAYKLRIRVMGGYDETMVNNYPSDSHKYDNIYTLSEMKRIYKEIEEIEKGINPNWDEFQKLMYFIGYLKNKIIYHPFFETAPSLDIRSLRCLYSRQTVCAGFALVLKELCDRNGIKCHYVEGATNEENHQKDYRTHAWNLVEIEGKILPVDLTWNTSANNRGKTADTLMLFNATEFVKKHIPAKKERIQNYEQVLSSVDGAKVRLVNAMINKDMRLENNIFYGTRKDGSKYEVQLVGQTIQDNQVVYKYIYQGLRSDGTLSAPVVLYSKMNVSSIVSGIKQVEKLKKQAAEARRKGDYSEAQRIENSIRPERVQYLYDANNAADSLLFSIANIRRALAPGNNHYLGDASIGTYANKVSKFEGVFVDTELASKLNISQKTCRRSDGTYFVIEDFGKLKIGNNDVYRYTIFERVEGRLGKRVVIRNTIFTDQDLFTDNRQDLYDIFLSRSRLDRKTKEANGYLGYYSKEGVKTYSEPMRRFFVESLFRTMTISSKDIRNYYREITPGEMKRLIQTYERVEENNGYVYRNKVSNRIVTSEDLKLHIEFAYLWLNAAGLEYDQRDPKGLYGFHYAFDKESEEFFNLLSAIIAESMNVTGNIDPVKILMDFKKANYSQRRESILIRLFSSPEAVQVINRLFRLQNPSALKEKGDIPYFSSGRNTNANLLVERRRRLEEQKRVLEVLMDDRGQVVFEEQNKNKRS
ncbi:MAG: hypothetical protein II625_11010 [Bacilli bacterium]|nr:hypothetical protein [Bacilli bacterium]